MGIIYRLSSGYNKQSRGGIFRWFPEIVPSSSWETQVRSFGYYIGEFSINTWWKPPTGIKDVACLADLKLHYTQRGKGLGSCMMEDLICLCEGLEFKSIKLSVAADNRRAVSLYKKFGFETRLATDGGQFWLMEKIL